MAREITQSERDTLETLIDVTSLHEVLQSVAAIAYEKASHIGWQDQPLALAWVRAGNRADTVANSAPVMRVSQ